MADVTYEAGKMQEFEAQIEFALNFGPRQSVKARPGDAILYDGQMANHIPSGMVGPIGMPLKTAVRRGWLMPKKASKSSKKQAEKSSSAAPLKPYDPLKGGDFEEYSRRNLGIGFSSNVIREDDITVKEVKISRSQIEEEGHEIAGDQVEVKDLGPKGTQVTSSTSVPTKRTHSTQVMASEDYGATATQPIQTKKQQPLKKKSFVVDDTTPRLPEGASRKEIEQAKQPLDAQEAKVVGRVKRDKMVVQEMDGVTLTTQTTSSEELNPSSEGVVVKKIGSDQPTVRMESQDPTPEPVTENKTEDDYLAMLPDDWGKLHWVKKEKFVQALTDEKFIRFILMAEHTKAVQNACRKRLEELGYKVDG